MAPSVGYLSQLQEQAWGSLLGNWRPRGAKLRFPAEASLGQQVRNQPIKSLQTREQIYPCEKSRPRPAEPRDWLTDLWILINDCYYRSLPGGMFLPHQRWTAPGLNLSNRVEPTMPLPLSIVQLLDDAHTYTCLCPVHRGTRVEREWKDAEESIPVLSRGRGIKDDHSYLHFASSMTRMEGITPRAHVSSVFLTVEMSETSNPCYFWTCLCNMLAE